MGKIDKSENIKKEASLQLPEVDWLEKESDPKKFFKDLKYALSEFGFMVLTNAPGLSDEFQQQVFKEVRGFFDSPVELKKTSYIGKTPYFRGYSLPTPVDSGFGQLLKHFSTASSRSLYVSTMINLSLSIADYFAVQTLGQTKSRFQDFDRLLMI